MRRFITGLVSALFVLALSGCGGAQNTSSTTASTNTPSVSASSPTVSASKPAVSASSPAPSASNSAWKITIEGAGQQTTLTSQDFDKIGTTTAKAAMKNQDSTGPADEYTGVSLAKVVKYLGVNQYTTIKVESADGTGKEYTPDLVDSDGTLLATAMAGKALDSATGPVELVVNGKGSAWWIKQVTKITVIK